MHYLAREADLWRFQQLQKRQPKNQQRWHVLLISTMAGFSGFVRSLQKEPEYEHVRGLHVLDAAVGRELPAVLIQQAHRVFEENCEMQCLFVREDDEGGGALLMCEQFLQDAQSTNPRTFLAPYGCFFARSPEHADKLGVWKAIDIPRPRAEMATENSSPTISVAVEYASVNFRDALIGFGKLDREDAIKGYGRSGSGFGLDFGGYCLREDADRSPRMKVIGLGRDCMGNQLHEQPKYLCWELDNDADLEAYATVPCAYATAYYALCARGRLHADCRVLVHCGTGGVGLAALHICRRRLANPDLQLFVTCGSDAKRKYLIDTIGIPTANIGDSRSCSFSDLVRERTNGQGVHLALNSLTGELMKATVACLSFCGVLLELGKQDSESSEMQQLRRGDKAIMMVDLDQLMAHEADFEAVHKALSDGLGNGEVVPLERTVFLAPTQTEDAFQYMFESRRIGKVVLKITHDNLRAQVPSMAAMVPEQLDSRVQAIVIIGGFGGLGLCLAQWIAGHFGYACRIILCGKSGPCTSEHERALRHLREHQGAAIDVRAGDFSQYMEVTSLLEHLRDGRWPSTLLGIFNAAASTEDVAFDRMSSAAWQRPFAPKVEVTRNFARAVDEPDFADVCSSLQYFVSFSSVVAGLGNASQTNYACANAAMEQIVLDRAARGKPGLCVRLGLVPHVGLAMSVNNAADVNHLRPISIQSALQQLERLIASNENGLHAIYGESISTFNSTPEAHAWHRLCVTSVSSAGHTCSRPSLAMHAFTDLHMPYLGLLQVAADSQLTSLANLYKAIF